MAETSGGDRPRRRSKIAPHDSLHGHEAPLRATLPWALALLGGYLGAAMIIALGYSIGVFALGEWEVFQSVSSDFIDVAELGLDLLFLTIAAHGLERAGLLHAVVSVRPVMRKDLRAAVWVAGGSLAFAFLPEIVAAFETMLIETPAPSNDAPWDTGAKISPKSADVGDAGLVATLSRWLILGILLIVAAPIVEEFVFRGWVQPLFRNMGLSRVSAIGLTSVLFGIIHPWPMGVVGAFVSGVLFGWARERTGRLAAPMVAHALHNAVVFIVEIAEAHLLV